MKDKISFKYQRPALISMAYFTERMILDCQHSHEGFLRQVILQKLLKDKLEKYRHSSDQEFSVKMKLDEAIAFLIQAQISDWSQMHIYHKVVIGNTIKKIDQVVYERMQLLSAEEWLHEKTSISSLR